MLNQMSNKLLCAVYRSLLSAHPPSFRDEFGDEMLLIFEESTADRLAGAAPLLADCLVSAFRQWFVGYQVWKPVLAMGYWFVFFLYIVTMLWHPSGLLRH
jgi:hypothetical protein